MEAGDDAPTLIESTDVDGRDKLVVAQFTQTSRIIEIARVQEQLNSGPPFAGFRDAVEGAR